MPSYSHQRLVLGGAKVMMLAGIRISSVDQQALIVLS